MPTSIKAAGWLWLIFGSIMVLSTIFLVFVVFSKGIAGMELLVFLIPSLLGTYFMWIGWRTLKGKVKGVLGNGIGCLALGAIAAYSFKQDPAVHIAFAALFFSSGILALIGRSGYKKFKLQT
jgi:hypothetical protein